MAESANSNLISTVFKNAAPVAILKMAESTSSKFEVRLAQI